MSSRKEFEVMMRRWFRNATGEATPTAALLPLALDAVQIVQNEMIRRDVASIRENQRRSDELLSSLSEHTREFEESASRALSEQTDRLADLQASTSAALLATAARAREDVLRERRDRMRDIDRLDATVGDLVADRDLARDAAERWLADSRTLAAIIATTLPHEDYQPRALADIEARLAIVTENLDQGLPGPALSLAQDAYRKLSDLRLDLELRHREWLTIRWEAVRSVTVVKEVISHARLVPAVDLLPADGTGEAEARAEPAGPAAIDLDGRSAARLRELEDETDAVLATLRDDAPRLTIAELREVVTADAPRLEEQVEQTIAAAWQRVQASQIRANLADLIAEVLEIGFLYHTERGGFDNDDDPAASFTARLKQPLSDNEIVVHVRPVGDGIASSHVQIESFTQTSESDQVRLERATAITRYLRDQGFEVGNPVEAAPGTRPPAPVLDEEDEFVRDRTDDEASPVDQQGQG